MSFRVSEISVLRDSRRLAGFRNHHEPGFLSSVVETRGFAPRERQENAQEACRRGPGHLLSKAEPEARTR